MAVFILIYQIDPFTCKRIYSELSDGFINGVPDNDMFGKKSVVNDGICILTPPPNFHDLCGHHVPIDLVGVGEVGGGRVNILTRVGDSSYRFIPAITDNQDLYFLYNY